MASAVTDPTLTDEELADRLWIRCETATVMDDGVVATASSHRRPPCQPHRGRAAAAWAGLLRQSRPLGIVDRIGSGDGEGQWRPST